MTDRGLKHRREFIARTIAEQEADYRLLYGHILPCNEGLLKQWSRRWWIELAQEVGCVGLIIFCMAVGVFAR